MRYYKHAYLANASILSVLSPSMQSMGSTGEKPDFSEKTERIGYAISASGHNPASIAKIIGCEPAAVYQWLNGSTKNIKEAFLLALADATGFEARWLSTGEGPMKLEKTTKQAISTLIAMEPETQYTASRVIETLSKQ